MTYQLAFIGALAGIAALCGIVLMIRHERDAYLGRELRRAAGSESAARCAIESANLERLLRQKYDGEIDKAMRRGFRGQQQLPGNVVNFVPRVTNAGRAVNFTPDGAA
jgi:hypothetical protein